MIHPPFHDYELRIAGLPDEDTASVVVETIKESVTVAAPAGTAGLWQAHIFNLPESYTNSYFHGSQLATLVCKPVTYYDKAGTPTRAYCNNYMPGCVAVEATALSMGLINVHAFDNNTAPLMPDNVNAATTTYQRPDNAYVLGGDQKNGKRRLVSLAYEIHDTTAEMYKQGTLTAYRLPQSAVQTRAVLSGSSTVIPDSTIDMLFATSSQPTEQYYLPPSSVKNALAFNGTRQWEAKDGAYVVCAQDVSRNHLSWSTRNSVLFTQGDSDASTVLAIGNTTSSSFFTMNSKCSVFDAGEMQAFSQEVGGESKVVPYHTSGIILSGLNPNSTFTVTMRATWEFAPDISDNSISTLVYLAHPSPAYDPHALELYQQIMRELPVAVPVGMNAKGDFWRMILKALKVVAKPLLSLVPVAGAPLGEIAEKVLDKVESKLESRILSASKAPPKKRVAPNNKKRDITNFPAKGKKSAGPIVQNHSW